MHTTASTAGWLGVDWSSIALVLGVAVLATVVIVGSFAIGTRLLATGAPDIEIEPGGDPEGPDAIVRPRNVARPVGATVGAWVFYAVGGAAALYGIYLVIPYFHLH